MIDGLREYFGTTVYINGWLWGGTSESRGLRASYDKTGELHSPHKFCKAFDCTFKGIDAEEIRRRILIDQGHPLLRHISRIEAVVPWLHADTMNIPDDQRIRIIYP